MIKTEYYKDLTKMNTFGMKVKARCFIEYDSVADLVDRNGLFSDYKAVKEQNVYCMTGDFFQHPTDTAEYLSELRNLIEGQEGNYTYFEKLK